MKRLNAAVQGFLQDNVYAGDVNYLQYNFRFVPLFVYGNEKEGFSEHFRLQRYPKIGTGYTEDTFFKMYKSSYHSPVVLNRPGAVSTGRVSGEVYLVGPEIIFDLDDAYERGIYSRRFRREIVHADLRKAGKVSWYTSSCLMYTGIYEMFEEKITNNEMTPMSLFINQQLQRASYLWMARDDQPNMKRLALMRETSMKEQTCLS